MSDHDLEYLGSQFGLEIDGVELARFTGISGLGYESEVVTFQDTLADGKIITRKRPGRITFPDIVLKRGLSADNALVDWYQTVVNGAVERKSGSVVIYDQTSTEIGRWNFENAWISKWSASDLDAGSDDVMIEEITIAHEYMERA
ncbi:MAG: phage tail protein [Actinomycetota bacterium]|nr:phage tail protein [Actinomycetota bacterium]MDA3015263.1 phage tail protein [Actinomycetota bacterium]MDA3027682.1 phage tail protein [Actinomycetota bacterium]